MSTSVPISFNAFELRKKLMYQCMTEPDLFQTCKLRNDVYWLYKYYVEVNLFNIVVKKEFQLKYPDSKSVYYNGENFTELGVITVKDIGKCKLRMAAATWLTLEENWDWKNSITDFPEGMHYGLVLDYPSPILKGVEFLLDNKTGGFDNADINYVQSEVVTFLQENYFPYMLECDIIREVALHEHKKLDAVTD